MPTKRSNRAGSSPMSLFAFQDIITSVTGVLLLFTLLTALQIASRAVSDEDQVAQSTARLFREQMEAQRLRAEHLSREIARMKSPRSRLDLPANTSVAALEAEIDELDARREAAELQAQIAERRRRELAEEQSLVEAELAEIELAWADRSAQSEEYSSLEQSISALQEELLELQSSNRVIYRATDSRGRQVIVIELFAEEIFAAEAGVRQPPQKFRGRDRCAQASQWATRDKSGRHRIMLIIHPGTTDEAYDVLERIRKAGFPIGFDLLPSDQTAIDPEHGAG